MLNIAASRTYEHSVPRDSNRGVLEGVFISSNQSTWRSSRDKFRLIQESDVERASIASTRSTRSCKKRTASSSYFSSPSYLLLVERTREGYRNNPFFIAQLVTLRRLAVGRLWI